MNAATITALTSSIVAIIGAIGTVIALFKHVSNPAAHAPKPPGK